ncbi:MAG: ABC transporter permease [bacterium]|nr:ABC transporter permease [bacterium]
MNFVNRSLVSIKKRKSRSLILFLIVLLICNVMAGSISVKKALLKTEESFVDFIPIEVSIQEDYNNYIDIENNYLTEDIVQEIGKSSYVKEYYYYYSYYLGSGELKNGNDIVIPNIIEEESNEENYFTFFDINGSYQEKPKLVENGTLKITSGKTFSKDDITNGNNVILVSREFANKNKLSVGDKIKLGDEITEFAAEISTNYGIVEDEYTIIGIFEADVEYERDTEGKIVEKVNIYADTIYMPNEAIKNIHTKIKEEREKNQIESSYDGFTLIVKYQMNNINDVENFKNDNINKLPRNFIFTDNSESYNSVVGPMQNMKDLSNIIVYASIAASIVIIGLVSILFCKERKQEMGIYLALGEKKKNIALQLLFETLIVAFVAISISIFTGNMLARQVSNKMLKNQIMEQNTKIIEQDYYDSEVLIDDDKVMSNYNVSLDIYTIFIIYIVALGSISLSTILPIYYTLKLNPRKILM